MKTSLNTALCAGTLSALGLAALLCLQPPAHAQDSLCAQVKIEIKQELTLERQAFDAEMKISNGLDTAALESVGINVTFADDAGNAVRATSDPNDTTAAFFIRVDSLNGIDSITGNGRVGPSTTAEIHWLIIPSPGAGGATPVGKLYLVGATLNYRLAGEQQTVTVTPDSIYVKPLPKLTLDYFLQRDVYADDPFTAPVEPPEPFTLGVRIKNSGFATARNLKIESAQPRIVENKQGLLINFLITGSYVNDQPATPSLLINFGEVPAAKASSGRWLMQTTLSGRFVEFTASFAHADELGGALTSLIDAVNTHSLVKDVRVDLPGRDPVRDFLAKDGDVYRVYETDSGDTVVKDQSAAASLTGGAAGGEEVVIALNAPPTSGFFYVKLPDPYRGAKAVGRVTRSDGKLMAPENVWFSKTLKAGGQWDYFVNFFDANTTGRYNVVIADPTSGPRPPALQFIADRTIKEGEQVSFIVEASDPNKDTVQFSAAPLPAGAQFAVQSPGLAVFDWTPTIGQAGQYAIAFSASDGTLESTQLARITVQPAQRPAGPEIPSIVAPALEADVRVLRPILMVQGPGPLDTVTKYFFELYADAGLTNLLAQGEADKKPDATTWKVPVDLTDNTRYWWRVRAFDGTTYSEWASGRFFINLANDAPSTPQASGPRDGTEVDTTTPVLAAMNSIDADGDSVTMKFELFADAGATQSLGASDWLPAAAGGLTAWTVPSALTQTTYFWRISAADRHGAVTETALLRFTVNPGNHAPGKPQIVQPATGSTIAANFASLQVMATDADGDGLSYLFELDRSESFNSPARRRYEGSTLWNATGLTDNTRYYWRAKAFDGKADGEWVTGSFLVSAADEAPGVPVSGNLGPGSWTEAPRPRLEVAPALDPEGGAVSYEFEISAVPDLASTIATGQSPHPAWLLPTTLVDGTTYYWRARAVDAQSNASNWSAAAAFVVDTDPVFAPRLAFFSPQQLQLADGSSLSIGVEVRDPENQPQLSLYFDRDDTGADGTEIVKDLALDPAKPAAMHAWNIAGLPPGVYHVYGVLANGQRTMVAYAPGVVVIPSSTARGSVVLQTTSNPALSELGTEGTFRISLGSAPSSDVTIGLNATRPEEGRVTPAQVTFTPADWNVPRILTVRGLNDCLADGKSQYHIVASKALSSDTAYAGVQGNELTYTTADDDSPTTSTTLLTCNIRMVSSKQVSIREFDYTFTVDLTNLGDGISGAAGIITSSTTNTKVTEGSVTFGQIPQGGTSTSQDTFTIRQDRRFPFDASKLSWTLTPSP